MYSTLVGELLCCPICQLPLEEQSGTLRCERSHSFDLAREGYVNVLRKKVLGDTKEMLQARRAFFDKGYYQPVSDALNALLIAHLPQRRTTPIHLLDAGCGEGYYSGRLYEQLYATGEQVINLGIDISKDAVRMAAKRYPASFFLAADLKEALPVRDSILDCMLNIFAPRNIPEYARVLIPDGLFLVVIPGPNHIQQLREELHLLQIEENKQQHVIEQCGTHFDLIDTHPLTYDLALQHSEIVQIVTMTPNFWHLTDEQRALMAAMTALTITVDVIYLLFRRKP
ncbi:putative RNA methyltransferase [Dictyobacter arantiisoli]|uniref:23S rRNA (Guanine(745)-N(1))-methyltransferase n=1 Tax=Dictyobacter arantiisoli TaxID=2014874 RepID=A0A5A5THA5_9CHLR|nr:methyltransferase domain-containing protein [Dictyobacter arantiisoli]GCF10747.1 23S rRNA (guanine(745)-N(1))-methyltransferase [Dictyobacter arantiisoli]